MKISSILALGAILLGPSVAPVIAQVPGSPEEAAVEWALSIIQNQWHKDGAISFDRRRVPGMSAFKPGGPEWAAPRSDAAIARLTRRGGNQLRTMDVERSIECKPRADQPGSSCTMPHPAGLAVSEAEASDDGGQVVRVRLWERVDDGRWSRVARREFALTLSQNAEGDWEVADARLIFHAG